LITDRDLNTAPNLKQNVNPDSPDDAKTGRAADHKTGPRPTGGRETPTPHDLGRQHKNPRPTTLGREQ
jgi:hypothetical protein